MKFGISDNSCMFAAFNAKGTHQIEKRTGFFYAVSTATICKDIRLFKSHVSCYFSKVIVPLARMRGEQPFLFNSNFVDTMPKENEICKGTNNSSPSTTPTSAKTASKSQSKLEKEIIAIQIKVAELQSECDTERDEKYRLLCYIDRYCSALFSSFIRKNPLDSQDWEKLHSRQLDVSSIWDTMK